MSSRNVFAFYNMFGNFFKRMEWIIQKNKKNGMDNSKKIKRMEHGVFFSRVIGSL